MIDMENYYFINRNGSKLGPFKLGDLKNQLIYSDELVWRSDSENWKKASEFEELNGIYLIKPPLSPQELENETKAEHKKTVAISEQLLSSLLIGFSIPIVFIIFAHFFPSDWKAIPITDNNSLYFRGVDKVSACGYECMLGKRHGADCSGLSFFEVSEKSLTTSEIFSASFDHFSTMAILGLILSIIIYTYKRVNFQLVK
jgi:hypothetical protein